MVQKIIVITRFLEPPYEAPIELSELNPYISEGWRIASISANFDGGVHDIRMYVATILLERQSS